MLKDLHVICVVSNPRRYQSRYKLYHQFKREMNEAGVNLLTVETAFGERPYEIPNDNDNILRLRTDNEIWHKENMINLGIARLPHDWKYVAWVDADISFIRKDWAVETFHMLQHHRVVQMWQNAIDLGPKGETFATYTSFASVKDTGLPLLPKASSYYTYPHPGFAWAMRRETYEGVGGLLDKSILGSGDHHMAWAMLGRASESIAGGVHPNYSKMVMDWQTRALKFIDKDVGCVSGTIFHHWHGKKKDRRYQDRWKILSQNQFDPSVDITRDWQGLYRLTGNKPQLRDDCRAYFAARNEDSTDLL